jgi:hypothetical protein
VLVGPLIAELLRQLGEISPWLAHDEARHEPALHSGNAHTLRESRAEPSQGVRRVAALTIKWPAFTAPRLSAVHVGEDSARLQTTARVVFMNMTSLMAARLSCPCG